MGKRGCRGNREDRLIGWGRWHQGQGRRLIVRKLEERRQLHCPEDSGHVCVHPEDRQATLSGSDSTSQADEKGDTGTREEFDRAEVNDHSRPRPLVDYSVNFEAILIGLAVVDPHRVIDRDDHRSSHLTGLERLHEEDFSDREGRGHGQTDGTATARELGLEERG
jgi:hypothetical protein